MATVYIVVKTHCVEWVGTFDKVVATVDDKTTAELLANKLQELHDAQEYHGDDYYSVEEFETIRQEEITLALLDGIAEDIFKKENER